ncbi:unnamed protein product [Adineta steineri]|uniref:Uncharacterized protein n=1 Tax=Adineta steineri TaxID=433720 RepID=A0A819YAC9_9BILA|nr:unnamed protein product [Adineta steineri]
MIIEKLLDNVCCHIRCYLGVASLVPELGDVGSGIGNCVLFLRGGAVKEAYRIKQAFSLLAKHNKKSVKDIFFDHPDVAHVFHELLNYVIIFSSASKMLEDDEEDREINAGDKLDYGYLEFEYTSQVDVV